MKWNNEGYQRAPAVLFLHYTRHRISSTPQKPISSIFCPMCVLFVFQACKDILLLGNLWIISCKSPPPSAHPPPIATLHFLTFPIYVPQWQLSVRSAVVFNTSIPLSLKWAALSLIVCYWWRRDNRRGRSSRLNCLPGGNGRSVSPGHGAKTIILITAGQLTAGQKKTLLKGEMSVSPSVCVFTSCPPRSLHTFLYFSLTDNTSLMTLW